MQPLVAALQEWERQEAARGPLYLPDQPRPELELPLVRSLSCRCQSSDTQGRTDFTISKPSSERVYEVEGSERGEGAVVNSHSLEKSPASVG